MADLTIQHVFQQFYPFYLEKYSPSIAQQKVANAVCNFNSYITSVFPNSCTSPSSARSWEQEPCHSVPAP